MNEWSLQNSISQNLETLCKVKVHTCMCVCVCVFIIGQVFPRSVWILLAAIMGDTSSG